MAQIGDKIKIITSTNNYEGILMPEEKEFLIIKLENGYNIGIDKKRIKKVELMQKKEDKKEDKKTLTQKKNLPKITILHTGGTIASKVDYETGGVIARFQPEEILEMFPELKELAQIKSRLISNMWSEDMNFNHYNILAKEIKRELDEGAEGIIITHGTDTMHYTGAALSFILQNLGKPVIIVGAQRSSDRASSDAGINLISAALFITKTDYAGVGVCMHENINDKNCLIFLGTKCRKMHSSRRDAFKAVNSTPVARINYENQQIEFLNTNYIKKNNNKLELKILDPKIKVAILKIHTNMRTEQFLFYENYDGLIIEGTGIAGNMPINEIDEYTKENTKIKKALEKLVKRGVVMAAATQTIYGGINMNVYSTGRIMQELGILGNHTDMHPETAFVKLAWLLSNYDKEKAKELYSKNLVGEISDREEFT